MNNKSRIFKQTEIGEIPKEWDIKFLGEISRRIFTGRDPKGGKLSHSNDITEYRIIQSAAVFDGYLDIEKTGYLSSTLASELSSAKVEIHDVLLNQLGDGITFARSCVVPSKIIPAYITRSVGAIRVDEKMLDPYFLNAFFTLDSTKSYIESFNSGSSRRAIDCGKMRQFLIPVPPLVEQQAIGRFYRDICEKIDLNRQMNKTLEAIAQAIFKHWFVDFEFPDKNGNPYKSSGGKMVESELGEIPEGWTMGKLDEIISINTDTINPQEYQDEVFDYYSIPAYDEGQKSKVEPGIEIKSNKYLIPPNAILLSKLNPRIPRVWWPKLSERNRAICSTEFIVVTSKSNGTREYIYCLFNSPQFKNVFSNLVTGTSGSHQRVRPEYLSELDAIIPSTEVIKRFSGYTESLFKNIIRKINEIDTLASIRDSLLPKLMSGRIRLLEI